MSECKTFYLDGWDGKAEGGWYIKNDMCEFFKKLHGIGLKPVGIRIDDTFNVEVLVQEIVEKEKSGG